MNSRDNPEQLDTIQRLANHMRAKHETRDRPYVLLLGSGLSLTSEVRHAVCNSDDWSTFLTTLGDCSPAEQRAKLAEPLSKLGLRDGYACLTQLVRDGYFDVVLTLNVDDALDDALRKLPSRECAIYVYGESSAKEFIDSLARVVPRVKVVKLRGDINRYKLLLTPGAQFEFPPELELRIGELLASDTIVVGDLAIDTDIQRCIHATEGALWVIVPEELKTGEFLYRAKLARRAGDVIIVRDNPLTHFFCFLYAALGDTTRKPSHYFHFITEVPIPDALGPPQPPRPFIGRKKDITALSKALRGGGVHVVSGMPGVGKSAIAAQLAQSLSSEFPDGVFWISLESKSVPSPNMVWAQIADVFGWSPPSDIDDSLSYLESAISNLLTIRRCLLIIDGAESAPETVAALVKARGTSTVLITTRDRGLAANYGAPYHVDILSRYAAFKLFRSHCRYSLRRTKEESECIHTICKVLGWLPLAINLAASFVATYNVSVQEYLTLLRERGLRYGLHLDETPDRSIWLTFGSVWERLSEHRRLLLTVIALALEDELGLEPIATVAQLDLQSTYDELNTLVSQSLIDRVTGKSQHWKEAAFTLHPVVRGYVRENASSSKRDTVGTRLVSFYFAREVLKPAVTISRSRYRSLISRVAITKARVLHKRAVDPSFSLLMKSVSAELTITYPFHSGYGLRSEIQDFWSGIAPTTGAFKSNIDSVNGNNDDSVKDLSPP